VQFGTKVNTLDLEAKKSKSRRDQIWSKIWCCKCIFLVKAYRSLFHHVKTI